MSLEINKSGRSFRSDSTLAGTMNSASMPVVSETESAATAGLIR